MRSGAVRYPPALAGAGVWLTQPFARRQIRTSSDGWTWKHGCWLCPDRNHQARAQDCVTHTIFLTRQKYRAIGVYNNILPPYTATPRSTRSFPTVLSPPSLPPYLLCRLNFLFVALAPFFCAP